MGKIKIFVAGGTGFIGSAIVKTAFDNGYDVISLSRRGHPLRIEPWMKQVKWIKGDLLEPSTWSKQLDGVYAVVHAVGIIKEIPSKDITFKKINGESAIILAEESEKSGIKRFAFISAYAKPPIISKDYILSKRKAEEYISKKNFNSVIFRPGPVYDTGKMQYLYFSVYKISKLPFVGKPFDVGIPINVKSLAKATIKCIENNSINGVINPKSIIKISEL
ncbi:MAG: NAD-dependent epimerase/dehydratase family protein [Thermoplasmata archaeon]